MLVRVQSAESQIVNGIARKENNMSEETIQKLVNYFYECYIEDQKKGLVQYE